MSDSPDLVSEKIVAKEEGPDVAIGEVNASGHKDQLRRQYRLLALCALALNIDNAWIALGGSVTIAIGKLDPEECNGKLVLIAIQRTVALQASSTSSL